MDTSMRSAAREIPAPAVPLLAMSAVMWAGEIVDVVVRGRLDRFGIRPRRLDGLDGIVLAPFLHSGFGHLIANTVPFLVLGMVIAFSGTRLLLRVTAIVAAVAGVGTWLFGTTGLHIGASGIVFGYLTYLLARGVVARRAAYLVVGVIVFLAYGSVLWGLVPVPGISWTGHLFGALGGIGAAFAVHRRGELQAIAA